MQLAVKLFLAPLFVVGASLVVRRFGPVVGGLVGGLPVVAGPILLAYDLDQGDAFAADAAVGTLLGLISLTAFMVVYASLAGRRRWPVCLVAGWAAFGVGTVVLSGVDVGAWVAFGLALLAFAAALAVLPRGADDVPVPVHPGWDLPARAGSALALVLLLTAVAEALGPTLSGLLAPFPVIASILAAFTHAQAGSGHARRLLRGMVTGYLGFALFCLVVAQTVVPLGTAPAFLLATLAALAAQGVLVLRALR
jgi:hypothetical protein